MPSISITALVLTAAATGMKVMGDIQAGQAKASAAKYNAQVARNNAIYASAAGSSQAAAESMKNADLLGRIKAGIGANNVDINTGSAKDVRGSARILGNIDAQTVENNALL